MIKFVISINIIILFKHESIGVIIIVAIKLAFKFMFYIKNLLKIYFYNWTGIYETSSVVPEFLTR